MVLTSDTPMTVYTDTGKLILATTEKACFCSVCDLYSFHNSNIVIVCRLTLFCYKYYTYYAFTFINTVSEYDIFIYFR